MHDVSGDNLVGYDRRSRPYMKMGPLAWWLAGLATSSVMMAVIIINFSPPLHTPARRWLGVAFIVWTVAYLAVGARIFITRIRLYAAELRSRGQRHAVPTRDTDDQHG